jgi:hypothetical protein
MCNSISAGPAAWGPLSIGFEPLADGLDEFGDVREGGGAQQGLVHDGCIISRRRVSRKANILRL